jgi:DNA-binding XRE family transcriptional regulator
MSRTELAVAVARSEQTIAAWEQGRFHPSAVLVGKVARALGISVAELLSFDSEAVA